MDEEGVRRGVYRLEGGGGHKPMGDGGGGGRKGTSVWHGGVEWVRRGGAQTGKWAQVKGNMEEGNNICLL